MGFIVGNPPTLFVHPFTLTYNSPTMTIANPHDRFFKDVFSRRETAQDFLQHYLPPDLRDQLDLASLEISKDSFIDAELQEHFSGLLYKVALHEKGETYI